MSGQKTDTSVVLVHGAWMDGSSWSKVIMELQRAGISAASVQMPLTSLSEDAEAIRRALRRVRGPAILVGHSYGGAPMTAAATGFSKVKGLVFVAALAPDEGETVGDLLQRAAPHPMSAQLAPEPDGSIWMSPEGFTNSVAPGATSDEIVMLAAIQKPIALRCLDEKMTKPAWREKPCWFLLAKEDRQIVPEIQRFMAERMNARLDAQDVDHSPILSAPGAVVNVIQQAIEETCRQRNQHE